MEDSVTSAETLASTGVPVREEARSSMHFTLGSEVQLTQGKVQEVLGGSKQDGLGLRVFEFFSGIGGLRLGLERALSDIDAGKRYFIESVNPYDVNATANRTYSANFGLNPDCTSIEHLSLREVDGKAEVWLLSPPCQPYTRGGLRQDAADGRALGLLNLLRLLEECKDPPKIFFLENVRGFETSICAAKLRACLYKRGFFMQEYFVSPSQLGIPTTRTRYFCLAHLTGKAGLDSTQTVLPGQTFKEGRSDKHATDPLLQPPPCCFPPQPPRPRRIAEFLEDLSPSALSKYKVPRDRLKKIWEKSPGNREPTKTELHNLDGAKSQEAEKGSSFSGDAVCTPELPASRGDCGSRDVCGRQLGFRLEVVNSNSTVCGTFTKGYGQNLHSGGPLLWLDSLKKSEETHSAINSEETEEKSSLEVAPERRAACVLCPGSISPERFVLGPPPGDETATIRFFTEKELLRLHGFPAAFDFPEDLNFRKRAALIGNSVSVDVVALLLRHLLGCLVQENLLKTA